MKISKTLWRKNTSISGVSLGFFAVFDFYIFLQTYLISYYILLILYFYNLAPKNHKKTIRL